MENYQEKLNKFFEGCKAIHENYMQKSFPENPRQGWEIHNSKRYSKLVHGGSAFCFVDKENGNVLKPASWKSPAKHARGNILDEHSGLKHIGPYGPAYLR